MERKNTLAEPITPPARTAARPRRRGARAQLLRVGRLLAIWLGGGLLALLVVAGAYTVLVAHNRADFNATIYENYRIVNLPGTTELFRHEGNGRTSYGDNGLVVNKAVNFDVPRLLFIGDSYVEAKQVSDPDKFTELLESEWNAAHADQPIQTLNMGLAGDDLRSYISFGPNMDKVFAPNLVFVMLKQQDLLTLIADPAPLAQWQADPSFRLAKPEKLSPIQRIISDTPFRQFFLRMLQQTQGFSKTEDSDRKTAQVELNVSGDDMLVGYEAEAAAQLAALQQIWGDRLVIIYNANVPGIGEEAAPAFTEDTFAREAAKLGIPVVNIYEPMVAAFRAHQPPRGFQNSTLGVGHFNRTGHRIITDSLLAYLQQSGAVAEVQP